MEFCSSIPVMAPSMADRNTLGKARDLISELLCCYLSVCLVNGQAAIGD